MSKRRRQKDTPEKKPQESEWVHREIKMVRTGKPPVQPDKDVAFPHVTELYFSSADGVVRTFFAAPSEREVEQLVRLDRQAFPGAHIEASPTPCPLTMRSSWNPPLEYAPAPHGESCQLETTVEDPASYLWDLLEKFRDGERDFAVLTQTHLVPHDHGAEMRYSVGMAVFIDGPSAEEVRVQCIQPWQDAFRCATCKGNWFEVSEPDGFDGEVGSHSDQATEEQESGHGPGVPHRAVHFPGDNFDSTPGFKLVRDALLAGSSEDEKVGVELRGVEGRVGMVAFGSEKALAEVEQRLQSAYPNGSVRLAQDPVPCPYEEATQRSKGERPGQGAAGGHLIEKCEACGKEIPTGDSVWVGVHGSDTALTAYHRVCVPPTVTSSEPCETCGKVHVVMVPDHSVTPSRCSACKKEILPGGGSVTVASHGETLKFHNKCAEALFQKIAK